MTNMLHFRGNRVVSQIFTNISFQFEIKNILLSLLFLIAIMHYISGFQKLT